MSEATQEAALAPSLRHIIHNCPIDHEGNSVIIKGWLPLHEEGPSIIVLHDVGESAAGVELFAESLARCGNRVYTYDMRGFSEREPRRGEEAHFEDLAKDLLQVVAWIKHKSHGEKPLIAGQGLGALLSLYFAKNYQKYCQGLILVSPIINLGDKVTPLKRFFIRFLAEIIPNLKLPAQFCPAFNYYFSDSGRLIKKQQRMSARLTNQLLMIMAQFKKLFHRLKLPALLICPDEDQLYKYEAIKRTLAKHPNKQLMTLVFVETREHDLLSCSEEFIPYLVTTTAGWLKTLPAPLETLHQ